MEISIVTGTYNRIVYLKSMINSARLSIGVGIPYEIVVVDGGSTDGTIAWAEKQSDIVLIKHGELLGAVKAFNDGARAATGRYVILANDDIEFIGYTIPNALSFMHDNPKIGIGCFYQDRRGDSWHVEQMPGVVDGKQTSVYYGQVCIVPRWLGDKVGWWGDYLRTYGGDNELSCNVLELGYKVEPVPCTAIHDLTPSDDLRKANNDAVMIGRKMHPDTEKWLMKWTRKGLKGPVVYPSPKVPNPVDRVRRIFYAPIYEPGHNLQKVTKRGLRQALSLVGLVYEFDYMHKSSDDLLAAACAWDADLFVMQVQDTNMITAGVMQQLRIQHPNAKFVNWNGDYHPDTLVSKEYISLAKMFDLVGVVTTSIGPVYDKAGIPWFYWQIGYEQADATPTTITPRHDVLFLANGYSKARIELAKLLKSLGVDVGLYGHWVPAFHPNGLNLYDFDDGARLYAACKIAISDSQWPDASGFVSNRLFQAMAAGACVFQQEFDGMTELLGIIPGEHLITWTTLSDLKLKILEWLPKDSERQKIAEAGQAFVLANHSFAHRVKELFGKLYG